MSVKAPEIRYKDQKVNSICIGQHVHREEGVDGKVRFSCGKKFAKINGKRVAVSTAKAILATCMQYGVMPSLDVGE